MAAHRYTCRPYRGHEDHDAMVAVRLGCAERDRIDAGSVVEGLPTAADLAKACAESEDPHENQILVHYQGEGVGEGGVVGYSTIRWWEERDGTWLYLHRGYLLPGHRGQGIGSAMLDWAENRIRRLVREHGTGQTAVFGANATAGETDATALLRAGGYRRVFSLVELELADLRTLPGANPLPAGVRLGAVEPDDYRAAWSVVVDSYADAAHTRTWPYERFLATAATAATTAKATTAATTSPPCWRAAWDGDRLAGVALCSVHHRRDRAVGEVEELSVRAESRRRGLGRALLLDGLRCLRDHGAWTARLYTGTANPYRSYDLYESGGFRRRNEYVRYRKPIET